MKLLSESYLTLHGDTQDSIRARVYFLDGMVWLTHAPMSRGEVPAVWEVVLVDRGRVKLQLERLGEGREIVIYKEILHI